MSNFSVLEHHITTQHHPHFPQNVGSRVSGVVHSTLILVSPNANVGIIGSVLESITAYLCLQRR